ncbi:MAG: DUF1080 domain-containing protein [Bryobacterales bacterium]|nr:DUF1080 domain-containing protein [Bryobacterales bacterium]
MKFVNWTLAALAAGCLCGPAAAGEWITLFDGSTLNGWAQRNGYATYRVEDGAIVGRTSAGSPNSFLCTTTRFGDFELEFEVRVDDELNSGVMIRSAQKRVATGKGRNNAPGRVYGPQVEIEASGANGAEAGYVYGEATGRGWLTPEDRLVPHKTMRDGEWNSYRIVAAGARIQTWINGKQIEDLSDEEIFKTHPGGFIGLQVHSIQKGSGPFEVEWRNIRIKPLN